jgi:hypothetical protein
MKRIIFLALMCISVLSEAQLNEEYVYKKIMALKPEYPDGMSWTNSNYYGWNGGIFSGGYGCMGFAFMLSDAAFGDLPARKHYNLNEVKVGDILRINNNTHSVVVIEKNSTWVTLAEGNFNRSVRWGSKASLVDIKRKLDYIITRYPE